MNLKKIYEFLIMHRMAVICALIMSFLVFLPVIIFPIVSDSYKGINIGNFGQDEFHYFSSVKEIWEGHPLGNILLREGKWSSYHQQTFAAYVFLPVKWLGLEEKVNLVTFVYSMSFLGVVILILLIYAFVLQLSGDKKLALLSALFVVGGYTFVTRYSFSANLNVYSRPIIPLSSSIVFFIYLNFLLAGLKSNKKFFFFLAGLCFGITFYVYFFTWTFLLVLNAVLFFLSLFSRNYVLSKKLFGVIAFGVILGVYEIYQLLLFAGSEMGKQILFFGGGTKSHSFILIKISFIALGLFFIYIRRNKNDKNWPIILTFIISGIVVINQQVITGIDLQGMHYFWHFIIPTIIISVFYMGWILLRNTEFKKIIFFILIFAVFANVGIRSYIGTVSAGENKRYAQNYKIIIDYLNKDTESAVILTSDFVEASKDYELLFTVYTDHDLFWHEIASYFNTPIGRVKDALYVYSSLNAESNGRLKEYIENVETIPTKSNASKYYGLYSLLERYEIEYSGTDASFFTTTTKVFVENVDFRTNFLLALENDFRDIDENRGGVKSILKKYDVKYIVWDKNIHPEWDLAILDDSLVQLLEYNNIYLYQLKFE